MKRCANCGRPIRPTTTWLNHDWEHDATGHPRCEGLSARPAEPDEATRRLAGALVDAQQDVLIGFLHPDPAIRDALAARAMATLAAGILPERTRRRL